MAHLLDSRRHWDRGKSPGMDVKEPNTELRDGAPFILEGFLAVFM